MCKKHAQKKHVQMAKMHEFSSLVYTSQDLVQTQKCVAQLHDGTTLTFRNSESS